MGWKILSGNNSERFWVCFFFNFGSLELIPAIFLGPWRSHAYLCLLISLEIFNHKHLNFSKSLFYFHQIRIWKGKYVIICTRIHLLIPLCLLWIISCQEKKCSWVTHKKPLSRKQQCLVVSRYLQILKSCIKEADLISLRHGILEGLWIEPYNLFFLRFQCFIVDFKIPCMHYA